jgi:amino acid adenylation domain-containing protein
VTRASHERLWLLEELKPGTPLNVLTGVVDLPGRLDRLRLEEALRQVVQAHPELRTAYSSLEVGIYGEVRPVGAVGLEQLQAAVPHNLQTLAEREAQRPLDLPGGALFRAGVAELGAAGTALVLSVHAIACDSEGLRRLAAEVIARYEGAQPAESPEAASPAAESPAAPMYWRSRLSGAAVVDVPADRQRPAIQTFGVTSVTRPLSPELRAALVRVAGEAGAGLEAVAASVAAIFVQRHTGLEDVVIAVGSRTSPLLARIELADDPEVDVLLSRSQSELVAGAANALSFDRVVALLEPERDLCRAPLAQVFVSAETRAPEAMRAVAAGGSVYDLELELHDSGEELLLRVGVARDLFDEQTAETFARRFATLLEGIARGAGEPVTALPLLDGDELHELAQWNATERPFPDACLHALIADQAARTPDKIAVEGEDGSITYAELDRRASVLAARLATLGIGRGALVGLCVPRSARLMVGVLGILKTGAAYVPIDPGYPADRIAFMLEDAGAAVIVTDGVVADGLPAGAARVLLDGPDPAVADLDVSGAGEPDDVAYVIYTSGSTGRPKGVRVPHRAVVNLLSEMRERPGLADGGVVVNVTTFAFDLSVPDLYLPLVVGAKLVVAPADVAADAERLAKLLDEADPTLVQATPTTWRMLVDAGWEGSARLRIACGGEAVPADLVEALRARSESSWHMYGPTETTVWSSIVEFGPTDGPPPIGGPIVNTRFAVVDRRNRIVPSGVPGELVIGGAGVALGYHERPELTIERFVDDPTRPGSVAYRTGDIVRRRRDGTLEFVGRADDQVKLRGFRVELGEIETVICRHPSIAQAVVAKRDDPVTGPRLVAYIVARGASPDPSGLREHLRETLPEHMVPAAFVVLDELPRTSNGKVDRAALASILGETLTASRAFVAPRTPVEEVLAGIWCEVLGLAQAGVNDDFFELGGNSLLLARMNARLAGTLGVRLPLRRLFEVHTLGAVAAELVRSLAAESDAEGPISELLDALERPAPESGVAAR